MKKLLFLLFFLLCISFLYSQNWLWAKSASGSGFDYGRSVSVDGRNNVYITGHFSSSAITFGSITLANADTSGNNDDMFIVKYDAYGNVLWAKNTGGVNSDYGYSLSTDTYGNVFVGGAFNSATITFGSITLTNSGSEDIFIVKYDSNGNVLWATSAVGSGHDFITSVSADVNGNVFVTGIFAGSSITFGSTVLINSGSNDIFISKYDANGNVLWVRNAGGTGNDVCNAVNADSSGNVVVTGFFTSPVITFGFTTLTNDGSADIFISKYDGNGNTLWAKSVSGTSGGGEGGTSVNTDASGNVFITGNFYSPTITFDFITLYNSTGSSDIFIAKYDVNGNTLWAKSAGGSGHDYGSSVSVDANKNVFVTGSFDDSSITFGSYILTQTPSSTYPMFIAKYSENGDVLCASALACGGWNNSVSTDEYGNAYITGFFDVNPFIVDADTLLLTGNVNVFVAKYFCGSHTAMYDTVNANFSANKTQLCPGDSVSFTDSSTGNVISRQWIFEGGTPAASTAQNPAVVYSQPGSFYVKLVVSDSTGSDSVLMSDYITVYTKPEVNLGNDTAIQPGSSIILGAGNVGSQFSWSNGEASQTIEVNSEGIYSVTVTNRYGCAATDEIYVSTDSSSSTGSMVSFEKNTVFAVYPNPASGRFTVNYCSNSISELTLKVSDGSGKLIYRDSRKQFSGSYTNIVDLSKQPQGVYFVEVVCGEERRTKKIIIE